MDDIEPSEQNLASYDLSKKVINLLRHNQTLQREEDGAIEFYKIKFYLRNLLHKYNFGLIEKLLNYRALFNERKKVD